MTMISQYAAKALGVVALSIFMTSNSFATWYTVKISQVVPRSTSGDIYVQMTPGAGETSFTGLARGIIVGSDPGAKELMAVLLTAISLQTEVTVDMDTTPSWDTPQVINSTGLKAP